jgi:hypothetical protein
LQAWARRTGVKLCAVLSHPFCGCHGTLADGFAARFLAFAQLLAFELEPKLDDLIWVLELKAHSNCYCAIGAATLGVLMLSGGATLRKVECCIIDRWINNPAQLVVPTEYFDALKLCI